MTKGTDHLRARIKTHETELAEWRAQLAHDTELDAEIARKETHLAALAEDTRTRDDLVAAITEARAMLADLHASVETVRQAMSGYATDARTALRELQAARRAGEPEAPPMPEAERVGR